MSPKRTFLALILPLSMLLQMNAPAAAPPPAGDARPAASGAPKPHATAKAKAKAKAKHDARRRHARKARKGKASYYGPGLAGKKMANGEPMNPNSNGAASKTLPLGTKAKVTNLKSGKSAEVVIKDRGPYVDGRIIDVTPKTADKLGLKQDGVAPVEVKPLQVPPAGGGAGQSSK